jgi:hypothetical protein
LIVAKKKRTQVLFLFGFFQYAQFLRLQAGWNFFCAIILSDSILKKLNIQLYIFMKQKLVFWFPRIVAILFIFVLVLASLDVFEGNDGIGNVILALVAHNIPTIILLITLIISWRFELFGGFVFNLFGIAYLIFILYLMVENGFRWDYLFWTVQLSGTAFAIGILFLIGWHNKRTGRK